MAKITYIEHSGADGHRSEHKQSACGDRFQALASGQHRLPLNTAAHCGWTNDRLPSGGPSAHTKTAGTCYPFPAPDGDCGVTVQTAVIAASPRQGAAGQLLRASVDLGPAAPYKAATPSSAQTLPGLVFWPQF